MNKQRCPVCEKHFTLGLDGVEDKDGIEKCDKCAGVVRDTNGYAWFPGEVSARYIRNGNAVTLQRPS